MSEEESIIGQVVKGQITNVVKFGAFIKLENAEVGLVHISEVSYDFISNIEEEISVGDTVAVKVLSRNKQGKLELSIKKAKEKEGAPEKEKPAKPKAPPSAMFEQKLTFFMKRAEAKHIDLRRQTKKKQGIVKKQKKR
eukprot:COSAG01_NODE_6_length_54687_cov_500.907599_18_plen_138_part_00